MMMIQRLSSSTPCVSSQMLLFAPSLNVRRLCTRKAVVVRGVTRHSNILLLTSSTDTTKTEEMQTDDKEKEVALRKSADWKKALSCKKSGELFEGKVEGSNNGGLLVSFGSLHGFLPFSQMTPSSLPRDETKTMTEMAKDFVGRTFTLKVIEANEEEKQLIFSEKQALLSKFADQINVGDVFKGKVSSVTSFGAFVDLQFPDGSFPLNGMVHISEVSWDLIRDVRDVLKEGQDVKVKVVKINLVKSRVSLSIKQLQSDPLFETLESVMPQEDTIDVSTFIANGEIPTEPLPGLEEICQELLLEQGISNVETGRQALEKRVVSQDLELWLSNAPAEDGKFTLLARAGRQVQEVYLETSLDRESIKRAVKRVTGRVP